MNSKELVLWAKGVGERYDKYTDEESAYITFKRLWKENHEKVFSDLRSAVEKDPSINSTVISLPWFVPAGLFWKYTIEEFMSLGYGIEPLDENAENKEFVVMWGTEDKDEIFEVGNRLHFNIHNSMILLAEDEGMSPDTVVRLVDDIKWKTYNELRDVYKRD